MKADTEIPICMDKIRIVPCIFFVYCIIFQSRNGHLFEWFQWLNGIVSKSLSSLSHLSSFLHQIYCFIDTLHRISPQHILFLPFFFLYFFLTFVTFSLNDLNTKSALIIRHTNFFSIFAIRVIYLYIFIYILYIYFLFNILSMHFAATNQNCLFIYFYQL